MTKKSHRVASRQAAVSKERKRKKRSKASQKHPMPAGAPAAPTTEATVEYPVETSTVAAAEPSTASQVAKPAPQARQESPRYQYVIADLRKIALIAGVMIVILIVLTFVLG